MRNITFYPGPSKVYSNITEYIYEAYKDGYMSINHRSDEFMSLSKQAKKTLRNKLGIPKAYKILFVSSATECWEIITQSLIVNRSQHFYNGSFGEKWFSYSSKLIEGALATPFEIDQPLPVSKLDQDVECICLTHNETSNGTCINDELLQKINKKKNDDQLVAIDATSSMAGIALPWELGDVWFASVQKCFGLPAGLGLMIMSPNAVERAKAIGDDKYYNSINKILANEELHQTHYTPNVLNIYLLWRTQEHSKGIIQISQKIEKRYNYWLNLFAEYKDFEPLVKQEEHRSRTVLAISTSNPKKVKKSASESGFALGNGYGPWKEATFRIANFPAIKRREIELFTKFMNKNY